MRVLVTGATGFIGGHLVTELVGRNQTVDVLVRDPARVERLAKMGVGVIHGDVTDPSTFRGRFGGYDILYHLANVYDWWLPDESVFTKVNVFGTRDVLLEAKEAGVGKIIYTSTTLAIGARRGEVGTEETEHCGHYPAEYCRTKHLGLCEAMKLASEGAPIITVMPGGVIGPDTTKSTGQSLVAFLNGKFPGLVYPDSVSAYVYVNDVVNGHLLAAEKGRIGEKYILASDNCSIREFYDMAAEAADLPKLKRVYPPSMSELLSTWQTMRASLTGRPPQLPRGLLRMLSEGIMVDNAKSVRELGIEYTPIRRTLKETIEWYRAKGLAPPAPSR